jgi:hypothetical protein
MDPSVNPYSPPRAESHQASGGIPELTLEEMRAFLGGQDGYYESKWSRPNLSGGWYSGFNGAALIFGSLWMFYRRMYLEGAIFFLVRTGLGWGWYLFGGYLPQGLTGRLNWLIGVSCALASGFLGNALYLRRARKAVAEARLDPDRPGSLGVLMRLGGTRAGAVWVGILAEFGVTFLPRLVGLP